MITLLHFPRYSETFISFKRSKLLIRKGCDEEMSLWAKKVKVKEKKVHKANAIAKASTTETICI